MTVLKCWSLLRNHNITTYIFGLPVGITEQKYEKALELYSKAIELNCTVAAYYGNRSFCNLKMEYYGSALADANKAIETDKNYIKVTTNIYCNCSTRY